MFFWVLSFPKEFWAFKRIIYGEFDQSNDGPRHCFTTSQSLLLLCRCFYRDPGWGPSWHWSYWRYFASFAGYVSCATAFRLHHVIGDLLRFAIWRFYHLHLGEYTGR